MSIETVYQVVKDLVSLAKMKEVDPICLSSQDMMDHEKLVRWGIQDGDRSAGDYPWFRPDSLFARTEAPDAEYDIVWIKGDELRTKRKVVVKRYDGQIDLVLAVKKRSDG